METLFDRIAFMAQIAKDELQAIVNIAAEMSTEGCRLQAENERLREALRAVAGETAKQALEGGGEESKGGDTNSGV